MPKRITIEEKFTQFCVTAPVPEVQAILRTANAILKARSGPVVKKRKNPETITASHFPPKNPGSTISESSKHGDRQTVKPSFGETA